MVDRAQFERGLECAESPLDFGELLVSERDLLGGERVVAAREQTLSVESRLDRIKTRRIQPHFTLA